MTLVNGENGKKLAAFLGVWFVRHASTLAIAIAMGTIAWMNTQYAIKDNRKAIGKLQTHFDALDMDVRILQNQHSVITIIQDSQEKDIDKLNRKIEGRSP